MRVKKNVVLILVVFLCALLPGCGSQTAEEAGDISSQAEQLLEVLCHQPYFERIDIKTNCSAKRADMIQRAARVMSQEPVSIAVEEGGLLKGEYYAVTHNVSSLIYYGDTKATGKMEYTTGKEHFMMKTGIKYTPESGKMATMPHKSRYYEWFSVS